MFFDPHSVGDCPSWASEAYSVAEPRVRDLGVGAFEGGVWALPSFSDGVPSQIVNGPLDDHYLARLSLSLHQKGFKLSPDASFTKFNDTIRNQLTSGAIARLKRSIGDAKQRLPLNLYVVHEDEEIHVVGIPEQSLDIYKIGPVFNKLESVQPGLGWYLTDLLGNGVVHGLSMYEPNRLGYLAQYEWFMGCSSDEELFRENTGEDEPFDIQVLREEFNVLPSDLFENYGGHDELFFTRRGRDGTHPVLKYGQVSNLLKRPKLDKDVRKIIEATLSFQRVCRKRSWEKKQTWHSYEDGEICIGGLAMIVWEHPGLTVDLVEYYEQNAYNSGEGTEELFRLTVNANDPEAFNIIANAVNAYTDRLAALNNLLGLLPQVFVD